MNQRHSLSDIVLRPFEKRADYEQGVVLQKETWGHDFTECVPASILQISHKVGGVAAGAFDPTDKLVGFVYGISGLRDGGPAHWSHMLAVRPEYRGTGIGKKLKALQRELLLDAGIEVAYWTYDPLISGNAHFNINLLGARPVEYVPDMYGDHTGSDLHSGLGTDRFVVVWNLSDVRVGDILRGKPDDAGLPTGKEATTDVDISAPVTDGAFPTSTSVRVAIPLDIQGVKQTAMDQALTWRAVTRQALQFYLENGYQIAGFHRDQASDRGYYYLTTEQGEGDTT